jgi:hypothetical protein
MLRRHQCGECGENERAKTEAETRKAEAKTGTGEAEAKRVVEKWAKGVGEASVEQMWQ